MRIDLPNMAGGEIAPSVIARFDTAKYRTALARARNVLLATTGGVYSRPGLRFAGRTYDSANRTRLIPFQFSVDQGYALVFSDSVMRIIYQGGYVTRPDVLIQDILQTNPMIVESTAHGNQVGWDVYFTGITGMDELNFRIGRVVAVIDANHYSVDIDATGFSPFIGSTGVVGDVSGGAGGVPVPPVPPTVPSDPVPPSPPFTDSETPPIIIPPGKGYETSEP